MRVALVSCAVVATWARLAGAGEPVRDVEYRLGWDVPEGLGCGSAAGFSEAVERRLGSRAFAEQAASIVQVEVVRTELEWRLGVRVLDGAGRTEAERRLLSTDEDCAGIVQSAALAVELLLSGERDVLAPPDDASASATSAALPSSDEQPREATPAPPSESTPGRAANAPSFRDEPPSLARRGDGRFELVALGAGYLWVLPEPTLGAQLAASYEVAPRWTLGVGAGLSRDWSDTRQVEEYTVKLTLALAHLDVSVNRDLYRDGRWRHAFGLAALAGALTPTVDGATETRRDPVPWIALGPRLRSRLALGWGLGLVATGTLVVPVTRDRFTETGGTLLGQVPPVGGLVALGIGASW